MRAGSRSLFLASQVAEDGDEVQRFKKLQIKANKLLESSVTCLAHTSDLKHERSVSTAAAAHDWHWFVSSKDIVPCPLDP